MHIGLNCLGLIGDHLTGSTAAVAAYARALARRAGDDVSVTLYVQRRLPSTLPEANGRVAHVRPFFPVGWRTFRIVWEQFRLFARMIDDKVDLLHAPLGVMPVWAVRPAVITVPDASALTAPDLCPPGMRSHYANMLPKSLARARRVIVPSEWVREELQQWNRKRDKPIPQLDERLRVIPWAIDQAYSAEKSGNEGEDLALRYGLPPQFVLMLGRPSPRKNLERLVQAYFAAVMSKSLPHRLVLAGPRGWGDAVMRQAIKELGLTERTLDLGYVPEQDLPGLIRAADAVLCPSLLESFPFAALQALACATPVLAADVASFRRILGDSVVYADPTDLPSLRVALETLLTDSAARAACIEHGQAVASRYRWDMHVEQLLSEYRVVLDEDAKR